jgi:hypothetical protein
MPDDIKTVVVERADVRGGYLDTPVGVANVVVQVMSPLRVVLTRVVRVYLQSVTGIVSAGMAGADRGLLPHDFLGLLATACQMSFAIAGITALQNLAELATRVDQKYPELRP